MQPDFQHTITVIAVVCTIVFVIGGALLLVAFRAFGSAKRGDIKHVLLLVIAVGFILVSCVALLVWSALQK